MASKTKKILLAIVGLLVIGGTLLGSEVKKLVDGFDFFYKSMRIKGVTMSKLNLEFVFDFINTSNLPIKIKNFNGNFFVLADNKWVFVGKITNPIELNIIANKTSEIKIPFEISIFSIPWAKLPEIARGQPLKYKMDINMQIMGKSFNDSHQDTFVVPTFVTTVLSTLKILK